MIYPRATNVNAATGVANIDLMAKPDRPLDESYGQTSRRRISRHNGRTISDGSSGSHRGKCEHVRVFIVCDYDKLVIVNDKSRTDRVD